MRTGPAKGMVSRWPWRDSELGESTLPPERAASRIESYVYGNVLVLAALASVGPSEVSTGRGALLLLGTSLSTFIAHVLAVTVGHRVHGSTPDAEEGLRSSIRDSVPILTSGLIPAGLLMLVWAGWSSPRWALLVALAAIIVRLVLLGSVVSYLEGERSTWRNALVGFGLALAGLVVAAIKGFLTH